MSDLIDRQAAIDAIESHMRSAEEPYYLQDVDRIMNYAFEIAASCIYNLPSAQPEKCEDCRNLNKTMLLIPQPERRGKWIYYPKASGSISSTAVHFFPVCSECGREHPISNYCPNCGARMEVKE